MKRIYFLISLVILFQSCANMAAPTGGTKDTTPPKLVSRTLKDSSINFLGGKIQFVFDEKIDVKGLHILSSPLLRNNIKTSSYKNKLTVTIPDSLLEKNTTYKISLGNGIKDIDEGNPIADFHFTFSTGKDFDSLMMNGIVHQASTGLPDTAAWVTLYSKINSDSDVAKIKPFYATKTNQNGEFIFTNLPKKEFYIYAIDDKNNNYLYENNEAIAFFNSTVISSNKKNTIALLTFIENKDSIKSKSKMGREQLVASNLPYSINIDTSNIKKRTYDITQPITIQFSKKITAIDNSKIRLFQDSVLDATSIISLDSTKIILKINTDFVEDSKYNLQLIDGFAKDSSTKFKPISYNFHTKKESDYGTIKLKYLKKLQPFNQIIELLQNDKIIATQTLKDSVINFKFLNPGNYSIRIINDENNNKKWDNGKYWGQKLQPETIDLFHNVIIVKTNWQNSIDWKEPKN